MHYSFYTLRRYQIIFTLHITLHNIQFIIINKKTMKVKF